MTGFFPRFLYALGIACSSLAAITSANPGSKTKAIAPNPSACIYPKAMPIGGTGNIWASSMIRLQIIPTTEPPEAYPFFPTSTNLFFSTKPVKTAELASPC